jgi:hypothetical protein
MRCFEDAVSFDAEPEHGATQKDAVVVGRADDILDSPGRGSRDQ